MGEDFFLAESTKLPSVLRWPVDIPGRHLDAVGGGSMARLPADGFGGETCRIGAALNSALSRAILYHDREQRRRAARLAYQLGDLLMTP